MADRRSRPALPSAPRPWPGRHAPLGATWDGHGTNFALFSAGAEAVDVCLFAPDGTETRVPLEESIFHVWHGYLPGVGPGQHYGFRVDGLFDPGRGYRYNPSKLLLDPYARAVDGLFRLDDEVFGYPRHRDDTVQDHRDSAGHVPKAVVVHDVFDWADDRRPDVPWPDTIIYEMHVRGFTARHPDIPPPLRGTFAGLAHPTAVDYLRRLGVTAVELMPVHHFVSEPRLTRRCLANYWGYNSITFFAPHAAYSSSGSAGQQVREFKAMVRALHAAGLEVILDVVYNHTGEGDHVGPTLSFRGIDNASYYRLHPDNPRFYKDYTGCGNTLDVRSPHTLQLIMDSLRYWVTEMHVDGFRFDLASALARSFHDVDKLSTFLQVIQQDPVVSSVKLIAEPWDVGEGGYQVGEFPPLWTEWNGKYRDAVRDFWRGADTGVRELGYRLSGSSDLYQEDGRRPFASINFVTSHDGFTLRDLVSYNHKHNEANGEGNRDGENDNRSWNCGVEGETSDPAVTSVRRRQMRNFLLTLLTSIGVPMLRMGDEVGHTQHGNNNPYCQDNELTWLDWEPADTAERGALFEFARALIHLRRRHQVFRRRRFFVGRPGHGGALKDLAWFAPDGEEMSDAHWFSPAARTLGMYLAGDSIRHRGPRGERIVDDSFLFLLHGGRDPVAFRLPSARWGREYELVVDTADESTPADGGTAAVSYPPGTEVKLVAHSAALLRAVR